MFILHIFRRYFFWISFILIGIIAFILGIWGYRIYVIDNELPYTLWDLIYVTIQLFVLESGNPGNAIPWQFEVARFLAPAFPLWTIFKAVKVIFQNQIRNARLRIRKKHAVIVGLGAQSRYLLTEFRKRKMKIVVIDNDPQNRFIDFVRSQKGIVITGDGRENLILKQARVHKAKYIISFIQNDNTQIEIAFKIWQLFNEQKKSSKQHKIVTAIHLKDPNYINLLKDHERVTHQTENYDLRIFNTYENSVCELTTGHPFDRMTIQPNSPEFVNIIIIGFGFIGERLILHAAQTCHFANQLKPRIVVFDTSINLETKKFFHKYPALTEICDIDLRSIEFDDYNWENELTNILRDQNAITSIYLVFDDPIQNLLKAIEIKANIKVNVPVLVRIHDESIMTEALHSDSKDYFTGDISAFGLPNQTSSFELIIEEKLDKMAQAIHEYYLEELPPASTPRSSQLPWKQLPQEHKDANRQAANHIPVKLRAINCQEVALSDRRQEAELSTGEIELLAKMEHNRWKAERLLKGWTYAPERDDTNKKHPCIVPWEKLPEIEKEKDRQQIGDLPNILKKAKQKIVREIQ